MIVAGPPLDEEPGIGALTLGGFFDEVTARWSDRQAMAFDGHGWTYAEVRERSRSLARGLLAHDIPKGTRIALLMGNRPEWVASAFAVTMTGAVLVPVNTFLEPPELEYVLNHCDAEWLLGQKTLAGHDYAATIEAVAPPRLRRTWWLDDDGYVALEQSGAAVPEDTLDRRLRDVTPGDDALVIYTSGTTARPKGIVHVNRAAALQSWRFARHLGLDPDVRTWSAYPFFWTAGFCMVMGATLAAGGCLVLQERFDPGDALQLLETERVTTAHAWPHQHAALEDHPDWGTRDLSSIRHAEAFSPFARHPTVRDLADWSPRSAYGTSETFTIISSTPASTPADERDGHHGSVLPGNQVRIVNDEITVKGPTLMRCYHKTEPEECFDEHGFFHTGDAGFVDELGRLHWTGRTTDMIKSGGANVSPVEVEDALLPFPPLKAAVVLGLPDDTLGEIVVVAAVAHEGSDVDEDAVRSFLRGRLASYKIPRHVVFFDDADITLTGNAKIKAAELRSLVARRLEC